MLATLLRAICGAHLVDRASLSLHAAFVNSFAQPEVRRGAAALNSVYFSISFDVRVERVCIHGSDRYLTQTPYPSYGLGDEAGRAGCQGRAEPRGQPRRFPRDDKGDLCLFVQGRRWRESLLRRKYLFHVEDLYLSLSLSLTTNAQIVNLGAWRVETSAGDEVAFIVRGRVDAGFAAEAERGALFLACLRSSLRHPGTTFTVPSGAARTRASLVREQEEAIDTMKTLVRKGPCVSSKRGERGDYQKRADFATNKSSGSPGDALPNGLPVSLVCYRIVIAKEM